MVTIVESQFEGDTIWRQKNCDTLSISKSHFANDSGNIHCDTVEIFDVQFPGLINLSNIEMLAIVNTSADASHFMNNNFTNISDCSFEGTTTWSQSSCDTISVVRTLFTNNLADIRCKYVEFSDVSFPGEFNTTNVVFLKLNYFIGSTSSHFNNNIETDIAFSVFEGKTIWSDMTCTPLTVFNTSFEQSIGEIKCDSIDMGVVNFPGSFNFSDIQNFTIIGV